MPISTLAFALAVGAQLAPVLRPISTPATVQRARSTKLPDLPLAVWVPDVRTRATIGGQDFNFATAGAPWSLQKSEAYPLMQRFSLRSGDHWSRDVVTSERSEAGQRDRRLPFRVPIWVAYDMLIVDGPPSTARFLVLGQFHATEDPGETPWSPPWSLTLANENLQLDLRSSPLPITPTNPVGDVLIIKRGIPRNAWLRIVAEVTFDWRPGGVGGTKVWINGQLVANVTRPIGYNDQVAPYWKFGVYRHAAPEPIDVIYNDVQVGVEDLTNRVTRNTPLPSALQLGL